MQLVLPISEEVHYILKLDQAQHNSKHAQNGPANLGPSFQRVFHCAAFVPAAMGLYIAHARDTAYAASVALLLRQDGKNKRGRG